jgi:hypothetical protein
MRAPAAALLLACSLAGCATLTPAARQGEALLSDAEPVAARGCRVAGAPERLPDAAALVDAAALRRDVADAWAAAGRPAGHVLLSLRYDRDGTNVRRAVLEHSVPDALADTLQKLVFAHRKSVEPAKSEWGVRLRMDMAAEPALAVGRWRLCEARPRDRRSLAGLTTSFDVRDRGGAAQAEARVFVRLRVDARGAVTDAQLESATLRGGSEWRLLSYLRSIRFEPASEDGYPVPTDYRLSLALRQ